jgi:hypothetical protein
VSNEASPELRATVAEGLLSALPAPLALETARKLLGDDSLDVNQARRGLERIVEAERSCPSCGARVGKGIGKCPNCGALLEADTKADYPLTQQTRRRRKKAKDPRRLVEATVVNNAIVGGSVTGTRTPWGGVNPAVAVPPVPVTGTPPPNLRRADGWERCGNCVFYNRMCNLYGLGRPPVETVHVGGWPVGRDDVCDSHETLSPQARRLREARDRLAEAEGGTEIAAARARVARAKQLAGDEDGRLAVRPPLGPPRYVARLADHLHESKGKSLGQALAVAVNVVRRVADGGHRPGEDVNPKAGEEALAAAELWDARAAAGELGDALPLMEAEHRDIPPSWNFVRHLHEEIARSDGAAWWRGMAAGDAEDVAALEEILRAPWDPLKHPRAPKGRKGGGKFVDVLSKLGGPAPAKRGGIKVMGKSGEWEPYRPKARGEAKLAPFFGGLGGPAPASIGRWTPPTGGLDDIGPGDRVTIRTPHGQERTGRAVMRGPAGWVLNMGGKHGTPGIASEDNIVKVRKARKPGPEIPGRRTEPTKVSGGLTIDPGALEGIVAQARKVGTDKAVDDYIESMRPKWGASWETIRPDLVRVVTQARRSSARAAITGRPTGNEPVDTSYEPFVAAMEGKPGRMETMPVGADPLSLISQRPGGRRAPATGGGGDELAVDTAIGNVLQQYGDQLDDWSLEGPKPMGGKKGWLLTVDLKGGGGKHKINVFEDGEVSLVTADEPKKPAAPAPSLAAPAAPTPAPPAPAGPSSPWDLEPTGEQEKAYHMADGQYFKGADGKLYQKLESGPKLMMGKKGPLAGVRIANVTDGTEKLSPAFALSTYYDLLGEPGGGGPGPSAPEAHGVDDVFEMLKKSVGGGGGVPDVGTFNADDFSGRKVVITGTIPGMTRAQAGQKIAGLGAQLQSSVTAQTDFLITGENVGKTKIAAAQKKGVQVVPLASVMHLMEVAEVDDTARLEAVRLELAEAETTGEVVRLRARERVLRERIGEAVLTAKARAALPKSAFALPGGRYPIHDLAHARNALARVAQHGTPAEQATVRRKVYARYPQLKKSD